MKKFIPIIAITMFIFVAEGAETCNQSNRCINTETNAFWGITFTPSYKNQYPVELLDTNSSCEDESILESDKTILPKNSYFRQTLDKDAQNSNEMIVHVYELDVVDDSNASTDNSVYTKDKYFSAPYPLWQDSCHYLKFNQLGR